MCSISWGLARSILWSPLRAVLTLNHCCARLDFPLNIYPWNMSWIAFSKACERWEWFFHESDHRSSAISSGERISPTLAETVYIVVLHDPSFLFSSFTKRQIWSYIDLQSSFFSRLLLSKNSFNFLRFTLLRPWIASGTLLINWKSVSPLFTDHSTAPSRLRSNESIPCCIHSVFMMILCHSSTRTATLD